MLTHETPIDRYFRALDGGDTRGAAALFAEGGELIPPLGGVIRGREAIADYLQEHCEDMRLFPEQVQHGTLGALVDGRVRLPAFEVRVQWQFRIDAGQIQRLRVRLVASLQELAHLRNHRVAAHPRV